MWLTSTRVNSPVPPAVVVGPLVGGPPGDVTGGAGWSGPGVGPVGRPKGSPLMTLMTVITLMIVGLGLMTVTFTGLKPVHGGP